MPRPQGPWPRPIPTKQDIFDSWYINEKKRGQWWKILPRCPSNLCFWCWAPYIPDPNKEWQQPNKIGFHEGRFHPGAVYSMRSNSLEGHSNQCIFDANGNLIRTQPGHGTVDSSAPGIDILNLSLPHIPVDVDPIVLAAMLDGCWVSGGALIFGHIKPDCVGSNMKKYFEVRPLHAIEPEMHTDCPVAKPDSGANPKHGPIPVF